MKHFVSNSGQNLNAFVCRFLSVEKSVNRNTHCPKVFFLVRVSSRSVLRFFRKSQVIDRCSHLCGEKVPKLGVGLFSFTTSKEGVLSTLSCDQREQASQVFPGKTLGLWFESERDLSGALPSRCTRPLFDPCENLQVVIVSGWENLP